MVSLCSDLRHCNHIIYIALFWHLAIPLFPRYDSVTGRGEFLQVSGLHVVYNLSANPYSRVHMVEVLCSNCSVPRFVPLNKTELYVVLMTSYIYEGGDGFDMFLVSKLSMTKNGVSPKKKLQKNNEVLKVKNIDFRTKKLIFHQTPSFSMCEAISSK